MKIIIDGLTARTPTWQRGIGKTMQRLLSEIIFNFPLADIFIMGLDDAFIRENPYLERAATFHRIDERILNRPFDQRSALYSAEIENIGGGQPDTLFWHPNPMMLDQILPYHLSLPTLLTIYDYIPLFNPELYLSQWSGEERDEYLRRVEFLGASNVHIAAISNTVAQQSREVAPISSRICAAPIAIDHDIFMAPEAMATNDGYIILVSGDDRRKNILGFLSAFCKFHQVHRDLKLKIVCSLSEATKNSIWKVVDQNKCRDAVEIVGFVSDCSLAHLVRNASIAAMPSYDEGFGLPIIEAMASGVPVVSSNIPASREVGGDLVYYFDPSCEEQIIDALEKCLSDLSSGRISRDVLTDHARQYTWRKTGLDYARIIRGISLPEPEPASKNTRLRIALLTPWPPQRSGVANFAEILAHSLVEDFDLTVVAKGVEGDEFFRGLSFVSSHDFDAENYDIILCQIGNNFRYHSWIYPHALSRKSIAIVHDVFIHPFLQFSYRAGILKNEYIEVLRNHFSREVVARFIDSDFDGLSVFDCTGLSVLARRSGGILVHNRYGRDAILREVGESSVLLEMAPLALPPNRDDVHKRKPPTKKFVIGCFGHVTQFKLPIEVLAAVSRLRSEGFPIELRFVGDLGDQERVLKDAIDRYDMKDLVSLVGFADQNDFIENLCSCDVVVNLRFPTLGESSGVVYEAMYLGCPLVVSDNGSFSDLPEQAVAKVPAVSNVREDLADCLRKLLCDPSARKRMSDIGRQYALETASFERYRKSLHRLILRVNGVNASMS